MVVLAWQAPDLDEIALNIIIPRLCRIRRIGTRSSPAGGRRLRCQCNPSRERANFCPQADMSTE